MPSSEDQLCTLTCPTRGPFLQDRSWEQHQSANLRLAGECSAQLTLGEPWRVLELPVLFTPALFALPWMAQPRPSGRLSPGSLDGSAQALCQLTELGTRAGLAALGRQPELPEQELLPAHTWGSALAQQPATVWGQQPAHSPVFGVHRKRLCVAFPHKAGVLLATKAAACASCGVMRKGRKCPG